MKSWVLRKTPVNLAITLDPKVVDDAKDIGGNTGDNYINLKLQFNYLMVEIYEGRDIDKLIQLCISNV